MKTNTELIQGWSLTQGRRQAPWRGSMLAGWLVLSTALAQPYRVLHQFTFDEGIGPVGGLLLVDHTLYGTTGGGGAKNGGTVYRIRTDGSGFTVLHHFETEQYPNVGLVWSGTALCGTTMVAANNGTGAVFRMNTDGSGYVVLHRFSSTEGSYPSVGLVVEGTTLYGVCGGGGAFGSGLVFRLQTDGTGYTVLKDFLGSDGKSPVGFLVRSGQNLYGVTGTGGAHGTGGTVYTLNTNGSGYQMLHSFDWGTGDGATPADGLVLAGTRLYGTTANGGRFNFGTLFTLNTDGSGYSVLKDFPANEEAGPWGQMVLAGTTLYGSSYGSVSYNGIPNYGALFRFDTLGGGYAVLKRFQGADGGNPRDGRAMALSEGRLYGTASRGGSSNYGVIFSLAVAPPALESEPPPGQTAECGSTVELRVRASGTPPLWFQWYLNETNLTSCSTNDALLLTNLQGSQSGAYQVVVTNDLGCVTSAVASLNVIVPVARRLVPGLSVTGTLGSRWDLQCVDKLGVAPNWVTLDSLSLSGSSQYYFDLTMPLPSQRFYRASQTEDPAVLPVLGLHLVPALTLPGSPGSTLRVDGINRFGPTNDWFTLGTATLTNTGQLFFDVSAAGQADRLYRLVPVP